MEKLAVQRRSPLSWGQGELQSLHPAPPESLLSYLAGVQSALYGLVLSLLICVAAVAVFTTHVLLLLPVLLSILGMCAEGDVPQGETSQGTWQVTTGQAWDVLDGTVGQAGDNGTRESTSGLQGSKFLSASGHPVLAKAMLPFSPLQKRPSAWHFVTVTHKNCMCVFPEWSRCLCGVIWVSGTLLCLPSPSSFPFWLALAIILLDSRCPYSPGTLQDHVDRKRSKSAFAVCLTGIVCLVVTIMYWSGWEMGAVEAISLSILVGSSVDYCVHLVEGYLLAGENLPPHQAEVSSPVGS